MVAPSGLRGKLLTVTVPVKPWPPTMEGMLMAETATTGAVLRATVEERTMPLKLAVTVTLVATGTAVVATGTAVVAAEKPQEV